MLGGPRRGLACGVGCKSALGGRCAKHRPKPPAGCEAPVTDVCSICLEDVTVPGPGGVTTRCGHVYHSTCLGRVRTNKCPNCRGELVPEPVQQPIHRSPNNQPLPPLTDQQRARRQAIQARRRAFQARVVSIRAESTVFRPPPVAPTAGPVHETPVVVGAGPPSAGPAPGQDWEELMMLQLAIERSLVEV